MKKVMLIILILLNNVLFINSFCIAENAICKENKEKICKEYDDFIEFFFSEKREKVSADLINVSYYIIKNDGSENDPLCDAFYK